MKLLSGIVELKSDWFIKLPYPMTEMEMARYRFDPITLTFLVLAATATGVGTYMAMDAAKQQAKSQEEINKYNAKMAEQEAEAKRRRGQQEVDILQERKERMLSSSKASTAKSGILSAGAPLLIDIESAENVAFDVTTTRYNTEVGVNQSLNEAQLYRFQAKSAKRQGKLASNAALWSGIGQMASLGYMGYSQMKTPTTNYGMSNNMRNAIKSGGYYGF